MQYINIRTSPTPLSSSSGTTKNQNSSTFSSNFNFDTFKKNGNAFVRNKPERWSICIIKRGL